MSLSLVALVSLLVAIACVVYAFIALFMDRSAQQDAKTTASKLNETARTAAEAATSAGEAGGLADDFRPQAAWSGAGEYVKALAEWSEALSKLKQGIAALVIAFGLIVFAGIAAGIDAKVPDADGNGNTSNEDANDAAMDARRSGV